MKKMMMFVFILIAILGFMAVFNKRIKVMFFGAKETAAAMQRVDLEVINDTKEPVNIDYAKELKKESVNAKVNEVITGGEGFMHIDTAAKKGYYEVRYPFPRPADKPARIALSQIINAIEGKQMEMQGELLAATGNIDDIVVSYEEIVQP